MFFSSLRAKAIIVKMEFVYLYNNLTYLFIHYSANALGNQCLYLYSLECLLHLLLKLHVASFRNKAQFIKWKKYVFISDKTKNHGKSNYSMT